MAAFLRLTTGVVYVRSVAGTLTFASGAVLELADGTAAAPSLTFASDTDTGVYWVAANRLGLSTAGVARWEISANGHILPAGDAGSDIGNSLSRIRDINIGGGVYLSTAVLAISATAPTISSGFGTSPSIPNANGTAAWTINVGTGGAASSGVLTMPTASTGWVVDCVDITNAASFVTVQTAGTTTSVTLTNYSRTTGLAIAWTASDILRCRATAY